MNGTTSGWLLATSSPARGFIPGPVLSNVFIMDLDAEVEHTIGKFADDTNRGDAVDRCFGEGSG